MTVIHNNNYVATNCSPHISLTCYPPMVEHYKMSECHLATKLLAVVNHCNASICIDILA